MKRIMIYRGETALTEAALADSPLLRLRGLIARDVRALGGLLLTPCSRIHTFHVAYPIDVVSLSAEGEVLGLHSSVPPRRLGPRVKETRMILELPEGDILRLGICQGDTLNVL